MRATHRPRFSTCIHSAPLRARQTGIVGGGLLLTLWLLAFPHGAQEGRKLCKHPPPGSSGLGSAGVHGLASPVPAQHAALGDTRALKCRECAEWMSAVPRARCEAAGSPAANASVLLSQAGGLMHVALPT